MRSIVNEPRSKLWRFAAKVWIRVAAYAVLHDQYIVRIDADHFTRYHPHVFGLHSPVLLAAVLAFLASIGPGFLLGLACAITGWAGSKPRIPESSILRGVWVVLAVTEVAGLASLAWVLRWKQSFYPDWLFPELSIGIVTTQTVQITCYLASGLLSLALLAWIMAKRRGVQLQSRSSAKM